MSANDKTGYLARYGKDLIENGYRIVPIAPGLKHPGYDGWQKTRATVDDLKKWIEGKYRRYGVGIITTKTPAIDLDVTDEDMALKLERWCIDNVGFAPIRVGLAPKRLLVCRAETPFTKINSPVFVDFLERKHKVEILGEGQQFVAYHVHPDTRKPYVWLNGDSPIDTPADDLPVLTREMGLDLVAEFERLAREEGWERKKGSALKASTASVSTDRDDNWFAEDTNRVEDVDDDELRMKLLLVAGAEDYDTWLQVGMALYHQFDGDNKGLELWHEWSEGAENYDSSALDDKWDTFNISTKGRAPVTARLILKLAKEGADEAATTVMEELRTALMEAQDLPQLKRAAEKIQKSDIEKSLRDSMVPLLRERWKTVVGSPISIGVARDLVRYTPTKVNKPKWCEGWVYCIAGDTFFNLDTKTSLSMRGFNASNERFMLRKQDRLAGKARPETTASDFALNVVEIPIVKDVRYVPMAGSVFNINGDDYANTYSERGVPSVPKRVDDEGREAINRVKRHLEHLIGSKRERDIFLDYLAFNVQNPGKKIPWGILLQGTEKDGKSFFAELMARVMGTDNVRMLNARTIEGAFNGWAEGQCISFIEEVKMHGHNRFDVINQIKPLMTNGSVEVHRKGRDPYVVINTTNYVLFTNFRDALPLAINDTRYFVIFSRWQTVTALGKFIRENPSYYHELYDSMRDHTPAIRKWLLNHKFSEEFDPRARAPDSNARDYMIKMGRSEEMEALDEIFAEERGPDMTPVLLNATKLADEFSGMDVILPQTKALNRMLSDSGFTFLGRVRIGGRTSPKERFWSQEPERFIVDGKLEIQKIRDYLEGAPQVFDL